MKTLPLKNLIDWPSELSSLKNYLSSESSFQIVGSTVYFEVSTADVYPAMMLEVVGVPLPHNTLELIDQENCEILIYQVEEKDLLTIDLNEIMQIGRNFYQSSYKLDEKFHIAVDNVKIELHFFCQKDYIRK